jgi:hypothetical protein
MSKISAAICYLTQNTDVRRTYLKTSLYFLFKHFNAKYQYPVIIFHEGDYDNDAQQDILMGIRGSCRDLVSFQALDPNDFKVPEHIDKVKLQRCLDIKPHPTPYWRNEKYRLMCRWWLMEFPKYVKNYDYVMRLDDDSLIEEPLKYDLFEWAAKKDLNYASNFVHVDCGICCYGMKRFFDKHYPDKQKMIQEMFMEQKVPLRSVQFHPFRTILSLTQKPLPTLSDTETLWMPIMYYNNFFITKPSFWYQEDVQKTLKAIDEDGSIFYFRWGDAPLQSILVMLHSTPDKISKANFEYSKRLQREAFKGDDGHYHPYMPETYDKSSCITEQKEFQERFKNQASS